MDESHKQTLIRKRIGLKSDLVIHEKRLLDFQLDSLQDHLEVASRLEQVQIVYAKFSEIQAELDLIETEFVEKEQFLTLYFTIKSRCEFLLHNSEFDPFHPPSLGPNGFRGFPSPAQELPLAQDVLKLPEIKLPTFNGDIKTWQHFRDLVSDLIVNNPSLRDSTKFFHLHSCLAPNVQQCLSSIPQSSNNFLLAWETLSKRYDNPRLLVNAHITELFKPFQYQANSSHSLRALVDHVQVNVAALRALRLSVSIEDLLISQLILDRLDSDTLRAWEQHVAIDSVPSLHMLLEFLERRARMLDVSPILSASNHAPPVRTGREGPSTPLCYLCSQPHGLKLCPRFASLNASERLKQVDALKLCRGCLCKPGFIHQCIAPSCRVCKQAHHTLLHQGPQPTPNRPPPPTPFFRPSNGKDRRAHLAQANSTNPMTFECQSGSENVPFTQPPPPTVTAPSMVADVATPSHCFIPTALVTVFTKDDAPLQCRVLLDGGSDCHLVTSECIARLKLTPSPCHTKVLGLGSSALPALGSAKLTLRSNTSSFQTRVDCLIVSRITTNLPTMQISECANIPMLDLSLADPTFYRPGPVDMLIGAGLFFDLLLPGDLNFGPRFPSMRNTLLGWIAVGACPQRPDNVHAVPTPPTHAHCSASSDSVTNSELNSLLKKFWEIDDVPRSCDPPPADPCEQNFQATTRREPTGRYVVSLPRRPDARPLGNSRSLALKRFHSLEKRLAKDETLRSDYVKFMNDYLSLDHMRLASDAPSPGAYYIPHHPVIKPSSSSTRLRVVFDASAPTSTGVTLNDTLRVGPTIQSDLISTILRFRTRDVAFVADVSKMYRQVRVSENDYDSQRILWRSSPDLPINEYQLLTVTYGTAPAAYLATRALNQLVYDDGAPFPLASQIVLRDFYVDDCISCCDEIEQAISAYHQLNSLLPLGGFELRKWASNSPQLLSVIPEGHRAISNVLAFEDDAASSVHALGLLWHTINDTFTISFSPPAKLVGKPFTKRLVLAAVASVFDPLGLIAPIITPCKVFMQTLWSRNLNWDQRLPDDLLAVWQELWNSLPELADITVPRMVKPPGIPTLIHLHVFADASETAYGACAYLVVTIDAASSSHLVCSKSRVAPLKALTIPRLELCAALVAARLAHKLNSTLNLPIERTCLWSDSTVVLAWIARPPRDFKPFVAARVSEIMELTSDYKWMHVPSKANPADLLSRGSTPRDLSRCRLWWRGPLWLTSPQTSWPAQRSPQPADDSQAELKRCHVAVAANALIAAPLSKFSSYTRTIRIMAYVLRFVNNARPRRNVDKYTGPLTPSEIDAALATSVKIIQAQAYSVELDALRQNHPLPSNSSILSLRPFLDDNGLLRVGGRLQNAPLPYSAKHQMLLPVQAHLVETYIRHIHSNLCHASAQLVIAEIRQLLWIPNLKRAVQRVLRRCLACHRDQARGAHQIMGQLPLSRVQPSSVFLNVGVDYAGPLSLRYGGPRSRMIQKAFLAVFVCMATTAVHIEIVTSLSTKAFLDALLRFTSRRGLPSIIYSDNATNFQGAQRELADLNSFVTAPDFQTQVQDATASRGITWRFIPPRAPHFGGLWETTIKSIKRHLRRSSTSQVYGFEQLLTLIISIEGILNSRPLGRLSDDPEDLHYLSPSHFLIGRPMITLPLPNLELAPLNRLDQYQRIQRSIADLWKLWSREYLYTFQRLAKWKREMPNIKVGTPVLLIEDNPIVNTWALGVIHQVHPGPDGLVRVVTVRTSAGLYKRPIVKIAPLPIG